MLPTKSSPLQSLSRKFYIVAALAVFLVAGGYLAGWLVNPELLRAFFRSEITMPADTAAGFMLAAALLLCARVQTGWLGTILRGLFIIPLISLGILKLLAFVGSYDLGLNSTLFRGPEHGFIVGRKTPGAGAAFILFAAAMMIDQWQTGAARAWSRIFASILLLFTLTSLLGYIYGAPALYFGADGAAAAMSLPAAILFLVLGLGVVWIRAEYGFPAMLAEQSVLGTHIRALVPIVVGAPILVGAAVASGFGRNYEGPFAIALTVLGSVIGSSLIAMISIVLLRRAESALLVKDRALAATSSGVVITDHRHPNEPITFVNSAFIEISGYSREECVGRNCRFLNRGVDNSPETMRALRECIEDARDGTFELRNRRSDGELFWNRLNLSPVHDYEGRATHFVGIVDDITHKREQEARLSRALDAARTANEMRNSFVRLVSHELRTPLNAALTWIRLMDVDKSDVIRDRGLRVVEQSIESQSRLIDDLVDVTRFAAAGVRLERKSMDFREIVIATADELRPSIEPDQEFHLHVAPGDYSVTMDPLRIRQIIRNLITNANKYTPAGGRIEVRMESDEDNITLVVSDSGQGLSSEDIDHVFEPFWRAKSHQPGLGVGLAIVNALVTAHAGSIKVESDGHDKGSAFTIVFPRAATSEQTVEMHDTDPFNSTSSHAALSDGS